MYVLGIPVLLVTIGRALRKKYLKTWKEALTQLEWFDGDDFVVDAYKRIEVSYHILKIDENRSLFLLCAQLDHHSISINDLLKYTMGLSLFQRRKKLKEVSQRLDLHLGDLKCYCMLQDGNKKGTMRMHNVVHKFVVVASREEHMFTVADDQLEEWPPKDELEQFSAISLPYCHLLPPDHQLPVAFDTSKLESFLLLRSNHDAFLNVPDIFFRGMKGLKLMDLRKICLSPILRSSLSALVKLRTLCLENCELDDIAVIGELPMLQVLSLKGSTISHLPKEIERLGSGLKLLDLRKCELEVIASGVLSNLTLLEDLRIGDNFNDWKQLQGCNISTDETISTTNSIDEMSTEDELASLGELKNLGNLINLDIYIRDPKTFPKDLLFKRLDRFNITIGWYSHSSYDISRTLTVTYFDEDIQLYEGIKALVGKCENLFLKKLKGFRSLYELDPTCFPEMKYLDVDDEVRIQCIVNKSYNNCVVFPKLESMYLTSVRRLKRICDDDRLLPAGSLQNLTIIKVKWCDALKYLFSSLHLLKEVSVVCCKRIETIVDGEQLDESLDVGLIPPAMSFTC